MVAGIIYGAVAVAATIEAVIMWRTRKNSQRLKLELLAAEKSVLRIEKHG
jgi:hypothetical protein